MPALIPACQSSQHPSGQGPEHPFLAGIGLAFQEESSAGWPLYFHGWLVFWQPSCTQRWVPAAMGITRAVDTRAMSTFCHLIDIGQPEVLLHKAGKFAAPRLGDGLDSLSARERRTVSRRIGPGWLFLACLCPRECSGQGAWPKKKKN